MLNGFSTIIVRRILLSVLLLALTGCSSLPVQYLPSQNYNSRVKYIVLHFTAGDYKESIDHLVHGQRVSSHYLIPENHDKSYPYDDLRVFQLVDESYRAWHAGVSHWAGQDNLNDLSIGIELINKPECHRHMGETLTADITSHPEYTHQLCFYPDYDPEQIQLLVGLIKRLQEQYPGIKPTNIVGHSDIAPSRKSDPGPRFPWHQLYQKGIGAWYDTDTATEYWHQFAVNPPSVTETQEALLDYGYPIEITGIEDKQTESVITAFQTHFLPWRVNGEADLMTVSVLFALIEKY